jgi:hypothetical protein
MSPLTMNEANQRGESGAHAVAMSASPIKANDAALARIDADEKAKRARGSTLGRALRHCRSTGELGF